MGAKELVVRKIVLSSPQPWQFLHPSPFPPWVTSCSREASDTFSVTMTPKLIPVV